MLASSQVDSFLFRLRAFSAGDIIRLLILVAVFFLVPLSSFGFYSIPSRVFIGIALVVFLALTIHNPVRAFSALLLIAVMCGNHPGGSYLEVFDFLLMLWVLVSEFVSRKSRIYSFAGGYEWLFFVSCLVSVLANRFLIMDLFNHVAHPYFILTSNETESFYAVKMLIMTFTCISAALIVYRLYRERGEDVLEFIARIIFIASAIAIVAGILEVHSANVARWLSRMRFFIDQDFADSAPHTIIPLFRSLQGSAAAKGLFWNRGWFGVYLIATFPFVLYFLHRNVIRNASRWKLLFMILFLTIFFYTLLLIGARGAFLAFTFSIVFYLTGLALRGRYHRLLHMIPYLILLLAILFPWSAFLDRLKPALGLRTGFFRAGFEIGFSNPLLGGGAEVFGWNNSTYLAGTPSYSSLHSPHNQMLQIFSGQGVIGFICYVALLLFVIRSLNRSSASNSNYLPLMSGFLAFLIYSSFQEWFYLRSVQLLWWLLIAFCFATGAKKDAPDNSPSGGRSRWRWIVPLMLVCAAPVAAAMQQPPKNFGFSPSATAVQFLRWRWVIGKEAWCEIPPGTSGVKLQLRNFRQDPFVVTVEIPSIYKTAMSFDRTTGWKMLNIDLPESSGPHILRISCDRSWERIDFNRANDRKLCIATHLKLISAPQ